MQNNFMQDEVIEKLVRYADGESDAAELAEVEQLLQHDVVLRERYENILSAKAAIKSLGLKQRIAKLHTEFHNAQEPGKAKVIQPAFNTLRILLRVAAVFIFLVAGYGIYEYATVSNESVFTENYISYQLPVNRSSGLQNNIDSLYSTGNYTAVQRYFSLAPDKAPHDYFVTGLSYLQTGDAGNAIKTFQTLQQLNNQAAEKYFVQETEYYLSLAYIRKGNINEARQLLQQIKNNKQHMYYKKAGDISNFQLKMLQWKK